MFVTFIIILSHFLKFDRYRDTRAYILDPCIREFSTKTFVINLPGHGLKSIFRLVFSVKQLWIFHICGAKSLWTK